MPATCRYCGLVHESDDARFCRCLQEPETFTHQDRTKRDRLNRLRERLNAAQTIEQLRSVLQGLLDLLGDEL